MSATLLNEYGMLWYGINIHTLPVRNPHIRIRILPVISLSAIYINNFSNKQRLYLLTQSHNASKQ